MHRRVDLFVFDLAGTVVADDRQVEQAFLATLRAHDLAVDAAALHARRGWSKERVFQAILAEQGREAGLASAMAAWFQREYAATVRAVPLRPTRNALETLQALATAGVQVAFNTGFARSTANLVLGALGLLHLPSVASDEVAAGRPAPDLILRAMQRCGVPDPLRVGVAGDTPADLAAGMASGARFVVGVGCGTHTLDELRLHQHTHLGNDLGVVPGIALGQ